MNEFFRDMPFTLTRSEDGDGLTLEGYAAVFDSPTEIDSFEGKFTETIARGAFKRSINARNPVLMFNHGKHPLVGDMPIGVIRSIREDDQGLFISARLADNWLVQPVRDAISQEAITGMSFRFQAVQDEWSKDRSTRTLRELKVPELGPVVFPAYADTSVSVRSMFDALEDEVRDDLARYLFAEREVSAPLDEPVEDTSVESPLPDDDPALATCRLRQRQLDLSWRAFQQGVINGRANRGAA